MKTEVVQQDRIFAASCLHLRSAYGIEDFSWSETRAVFFPSSPGNKTLPSLSVIWLTFDYSVMMHCGCITLTCCSSHVGYIKWLLLTQFTKCAFVLYSIPWRLTLTRGVTMQPLYKCTVSCVDVRFTHVAVYDELKMDSHSSSVFFVSEH